MKKIVSLLTFFTLLLTSYASSTSAQAAKPKAAPQSSALLYKITGNGLKRPSYIFGTIHIICPKDMLPMSKLNAHLNLTQQLLMELDLDDPKIMQTMAANLNFPEGKTIQEYLTPEEYAKVDELFKNTLGIPIDAVKGFKPFALGVMLTTNPKIVGCQTPASYDMSLMKSAVAKKKPVEGLESVQAQISAIDKTPLEKQAKSLYKMAVDPQKSANQFKELLKTYKSQNSDALYDLTSKMSAEEEETSADMLDVRNIAWIPKIEKAIKEKPTFIAVGAAHLGGKNGVIELLKAKGYKFQPIRL